MKRLILIATATLFSLSAFAASPVETVKERLYWLDHSRTVGQVLDNRPMCTNTNWVASKDGYGRDVVNYYCDHGKRAVDWYNEDNDNTEKWGSVEVVWDQAQFLIGADGRIYYAGGSYNIDYEKMAVINPYRANTEFLIEELLSKYANYELTDPRVWYRINKMNINRRAAEFNPIDNNSW